MECHIALPELFSYYTFITVIIFLLFNFPGAVSICSAELYNFERSSKDILSDPSWIIYGPNWDTISEITNPNNFYLTSGSLHCGDKAYISTTVDGPCTITFDWRKKGVYGDLICYVDNNSDLGNSPICQSYKWKQGTIRISPGRHNVTWDFKTRTCNSIVGSVADIDNISICKNSPHCVIRIPSDANLDYIVNALKTPCYEVDVESGANLQAVIDNSANKVIYLEGKFKGPINITVDNITIKCENTLYAELDGGNKLWNIGMENRTKVSIKGLTLNNSLYGIKMERCYLCNISNNRIDFSKGSGICIKNSTGTNIEYNTINSTNGLTTNGGICLHSSNNNNLTKNTIYTSGFCFFLDGSRKNKVSLFNKDMIYDNEAECIVDFCRIKCKKGNLNNNTWSPCQ